MNENLKRVAVVTLVSILVWLYAEGESLQSESRTIAIAFAPDAEGARAIRVVSGQTWDGTVRINLEGATSALDALSENLGRRVVLFPDGEVVSRDTGIRSIDLARALRAQDVFRDAGVTVSSTEPQEVRVEVAALERRELPIRIIVPHGAIEGQATAEPPRVGAQLPIGPDIDNFEVVAEITRDMLSGLRPTQVSTLTEIPLELRARPGSEEESLPSAWAASLERVTVSVSLRLRSTLETLVIPTLPVQVMVAPDLAGKWEIELALADQDIRDVEVTGPAEIIEQIRNGDLTILPYVRLTWEELAPGTIERTVDFSGVQGNVEINAADPVVQIQISEVLPNTSPGVVAPDGE